MVCALDSESSRVWFRGQAEVIVECYLTVFWAGHRLPLSTKSINGCQGNLTECWGGTEREFNCVSRNVMFLLSSYKCIHWIFTLLLRQSKILYL